MDKSPENLAAVFRYGEHTPQSDAEKARTLVEVTKKIGDTTIRLKTAEGPKATVEFNEVSREDKERARDITFSVSSDYEREQYPDTPAPTINPFDIGLE